jgi:alginate O-acetyltransferase complex protein AlgI
LVFLISGLWHGASWNFVLWGAFHGVFLILDRLFLLKVLEKIGRVPAAIFTFIVVAMAWVLFRLEEWSMAKKYFIQLFDFNDFKNIELNNSFYFMLLLALVFSVFGRSIWGQQIARYLEEKDKVLSLGKSLIFLTISILLLLISIAYLAASEFNPFIYYRF